MNKGVGRMIDLVKPKKNLQAWIFDKFQAPQLSIRHSILWLIKKWKLYLATDMWDMSGFIADIVCKSWAEMFTVRGIILSLPVFQPVPTPEWVYKSND